jgi:hypothetical protein
LQTFAMQLCPGAQSVFAVHCGCASASLRHTLSAPHAGMRASISLQVSSLVQV